MNNLKLIFNPITGNFDYVIVPHTKQEILRSILLYKDEAVSETYPQLGLLFDEDSILYSDDNFNNA